MPESKEIPKGEKKNSFLIFKMDEVCQGTKKPT